MNTAGQLNESPNLASNGKVSKQTASTEAAERIKEYVQKTVRQTIDDIDKDDLGLTLSYVALPGAIGGAGSVCIRLLNVESSQRSKSESEEIQPEAVTAIGSNINSNVDWVAGFNAHPGIEFLIYILISMTLGGISGFILTIYSIGNPLKRNCLKIASTAMLFGLFLPTSVKLLYDVSNIQAALKEQQVEELDTENQNLRVKNNNLSGSALDSAEGLEKTPEVSKIEANEKAINAYKTIIDNSGVQEFRVDAIKNLGNIGRQNITEDIKVEVKETLNIISAGNEGTEIARESDNQLELIEKEESSQ